MTIAPDVPTVDTVADLISLLQKARPDAKVTFPAGVHVIQKENGDLVFDDGIVR